MELINNLGIFYKASYLVQGNQLERCKTSADLKSNYTELLIRSDGKNSDISELNKVYKGKIIYHIPAINPDLANLKVVNDLVKKISDNKCDLVTINASNLSLDLFEWSTLEEQKKYFLNIVTAIATIASNKIKVAVENLKIKEVDSMFGSNIAQVTDIINYARRLLVNDFGFTEEEAENYIVVCLNIDNINLSDNKESISNWFEVFNKSIKVIKISNISNLDKVINILKEKEYDIPILMQTTSELEEIKKEYNNLKDRLINNYGESNVESYNELNNNKGFSNIIIVSMILLTILIIVLMFIVKLR